MPQKILLASGLARAASTRSRKRRTFEERERAAAEELRALCEETSFARASAAGGDSITASDTVAKKARQPLPLLNTDLSIQFSCIYRRMQGVQLYDTASFCGLESTQKVCAQRANFLLFQAKFRRLE
jgi:hypothetical protein